MVPSWKKSPRQGECSVTRACGSAVQASPPRVMNSDTYQKPPLGTFKCISNPIHSGARKRTEAYWFTASICFLRMSGSWATSVALYHRALAKGDEATHAASRWETQGSQKLLAPLKCVSVILGSRRVSREKGVARSTQGKKEDGSGLSGGPERHVWGYVTTYTTMQPL